MAFLERGNISVSRGCFDERDTVICDSLGIRGEGEMSLELTGRWWDG